jgi:type III restriction enzyme
MSESLRHWKPYQASHSDERPVFKAERTLFNLVPCNRSLEVALTKFVDTAADVAAFAKNAGPQAVRIDYLTADQRLAFYTPDFFVRTSEGHLYLVETKGRQDRDVPRKAMAAVEWCKAASRSKPRWEYVFIPQNVMEGLTSNRFVDLVRACAPALQNLVSETGKEPELPLFSGKAEGDAGACDGRWHKGCRPAFERSAALADVVASPKQNGYMETHCVAGHVGLEQKCRRKLSL